LHHIIDKLENYLKKDKSSIDNYLAWFKSLLNKGADENIKCWYKSEYQYARKITVIDRLISLHYRYRESEKKISLISEFIDAINLYSKSDINKDDLIPWEFKYYEYTEKQKSENDFKTGFKLYRSNSQEEKSSDIGNEKTYESSSGHSRSCIIS